MNPTARLLNDLREFDGQIDDRGLKYAEAICHRERQREERAYGEAQQDTVHALDALSQIRAFTKPLR